ncbi:hypothetical protein ABIB40_002746 [Pedobacter sp. UYP30]
MARLIKNEVRKSSDNITCKISYPDGCKSKEDVDW